MMEFWAENQGQSPLYAKFGTVPGRNCTHVYHDKHQATHYPLYLCEQQDQGRESSCWTVPGSRTGGALQDYTNWTDPELTAPSSHFPFILDSRPQQPLDLGEYPPQENRERDWIAGGAHRAMRESERGILREGWQRQWEPCSPVCYRGEVPKRSLSDSSYRELEAWAARYSHSLPRRKRMGIDLRGSSQGLSESSRTLERDHRSVADPRVAALHQTRLSANMRELGQWDRGGRQQPMTHYPPQPPVPHASYMPEIKEKTGYQRRMFSQPPGYIAPPPYNSPHKSSPVMHHYDRYTTSWEQEGKRQAYCSQPTPRKQDFSVDLRGQRLGQKENLTKEEWRQKTCLEFEGHKSQRQATDALLASTPIHTQSMQMQPDCLPSLQQTTTLQEVQNTKVSEDTSSTVIEGRKFKFNKRTGGTTIFCLVSRISGTTGLSSPSKEKETSSLPLYTPQMNIPSTELGEASRNMRARSDTDQIQKLADEVDFSAQTVTEKSRTPAQPSSPRNLKAKPNGTPTWVESEQAAAYKEEMFEGYNKNHKTETDVAVPEMAKVDETTPAFVRPVTQPPPPVSAKYPLWKEPSHTSRAETESSSPRGVKANSEGGDSGDLQNREDSPKVGSHPIDIEVRRLEIKEDTESEESSGLLVIDTTCVVVRMELIPSPKKEHVHYLNSSPYTEPSPLDNQSPAPSESIQSINQIDQDVTADQNTETSSEISPLPEDEKPDTEPDLAEAEAPLLSEAEAPLQEVLAEAPLQAPDISLPCLPSLSVSEKETLEERAERILGIPLLDLVTEQDTEDAMSLCAKDQDEEDETSEVTNTEISDAPEQLSKDKTEESESQQQVELGQAEDTCVKDNDDDEDQLTNEGQEDFEGLQEQASNICEENAIDSQPETDAKSLQEIEMMQEPLFESSPEELKSEEKQEENHQPDVDADPQCLSPPSDLSNFALHSPSDSLDYQEPPYVLDVELSPSQLPSLSHVSESNTDENPPCELDSLPSSANLTPHHEDPLSGISETCSIPQLDSHSPSIQLPPPLPPESAVLSSSDSAPHEDQPPDPKCLGLLNETEDAMSTVDSCVEDQIEEGETPQLIDNDVGDDTEHLSKDVEEEPESQQQEEFGQAEDAERTDFEEELPNETDEDLTDLGKQTSNIPEENATECQTQIEVNILQDIEEPPSDICSLPPHPPSDSLDCKMFPFPLEVNLSASHLKSQSHVSDTEEGLQPELDPLPSSANLAPQDEAALSGISETSLIPQLDSHTPSLQLPSALPPESAALSIPNCTPCEDQFPSPQFLNLESQTEHTMSTVDSCDEDQNEEGEAEQPVNADMSDALEKLSKDTTEEPQSQQQVESEAAAYTKERNNIQEELPREADDDELTGLWNQTSNISKENDSDCQTETEVKIFQDTEPPTDISNFSPHPPSDSADCKVSSCSLDVTLSPYDLTSQSHVSNKSNTEPVTPLEMASFCPSVDTTLHPEACLSGISETPPAPDLNSHKPSLYSPLFPPSESALLSSLSSTPPQEGSKSVSPDLHLLPKHTEEDVYPKSLWDAVNRIRKHTAPDSENEEEEAGELWDPVSVGEDLVSLDLVVDLKSEDVMSHCGEVLQEETVSSPGDSSSKSGENPIFYKPGQVEFPKEKSAKDIQQDKCHGESCANLEEDTLSCSSTNSHGSGDTVVGGAEGRLEGEMLDAVTESRKENERESMTDCEGEHEERHNDKVKDTDTVVGEKADARDERDKNESCQNSKCPAEVENQGNN